MILLVTAMWTWAVLTADDLDKHVSFMSLHTLMGIFGKIWPQSDLLYHLWPLLLHF